MSDRRYTTDHYRSGERYARRDAPESYRSGRDSRYSRSPPHYRRGSRSPPRYRRDSRSPPGYPRGSARRDMHQFEGERYRPQTDDSHRRGDFTFRSEKQARFSAGNSGAEPARRRGNNEMNRRQNRPRKPYGAKPANEREILHAKVDREATPDRLTGMDEAPKLFKALEDVSDTESENGSRSDSQIKDDTSIDDNSPPQKRMKVETEKPKWSNPDPYTALPPVDEARGKKKDVVQLIRKAKIAAEQEKQETSNAVTENADFISFGADDDNSEKEPEEQYKDTVESSVNMPTLPSDVAVPDSNRFSHLTNLHPLIGDGVPPSGTSPSGPPSLTFRLPSVTESRAIKSGASANVLGDSSPLPTPPPQLNRGKKRKREKVVFEGAITVMWEPKNYEDATPWCKWDHSNEDLIDWLHLEILEFYDYVKPHPFEEALRNDLIARVSNALAQPWPGGTIHSFGSYPAGIYLPTADMDLCFVSPEFVRSGRPTYRTTYSSLLKFMRCLVVAGVACVDGQEIISKAKVPIIKFVDRVTGLRVDISFENMSGVTAVSTFKQWTIQYPAMPILVTLIKQFLLMRDLNEVYSGGLGGFSTTCLVVSMLQQMPAPLSDNLGELLLSFFELYGKKFNMLEKGISLNPPGYFTKTEPKSIGTRKWSIRDPNNPANDISGGSAHAPLIKERFSDALNILRNMFKILSRGSDEQRYNQSLLRPILGGNYESFTDQRKRLQRIYDGEYE